jgi:protein SCO1/2
LDRAVSSTPAKIALIFAFAVTLVAVIFVVDKLYGGRAGGGLVQIGGPFTLVDQDGETRTEADFKGEYMLIYFGYTYCPDVCPTALNDMGLALGELGKSADKIRPVFITVDPARDTPERLKPYVANFHPRMVGLTGSDEAVTAAAKAYRVYFAKAKTEAEPGEYLMDHTSIIYLMSPDGRYLTHFGHGTSIEAMAKRIRENLS